MGIGDATVLELRKLMGQDDPKRAPPPEPSDVLYVDPAPGGERRNCKNCVFWASDDGSCSIMSPDLRVSAQAICGYHVFGSPSKNRLDFEGLQPVQPKLSGFGTVKEGTSCDNCNWYVPQEDDEGVCLGIVKRKRQAHVHPRGCCARWQEKEPITDPKDARSGSNES